MKTYLSIDIDFFNNTSIPLTVFTLENVISKAKKLNIPIISVMNHQQLLPRVDHHLTGNKGKLINVDYHADICSTKILNELNCGTWISYVKRRKLYDFVWAHPTNHSGYKVEKGQCQEEHWKYGTDWKSVVGKSLKAVDVPKLVNKNVCEIGLCKSPYYSDLDLIEVFDSLVKKHRIKYTKGVLKENIKAVERKVPRGY